MPIYPTLTQIAQLSALGIFSGPQASFASAQAIVSRLKRGQEWANKRLPGVIGRFAEFSPVEVSLPLVERCKAHLGFSPPGALSEFSRGVL